MIDDDVLQACSLQVSQEVGTLKDLPPEFADFAANIYYIYFLWSRLSFGLPVCHPLHSGNISPESTETSLTKKRLAHMTYCAGMMRSMIAVIRELLTKGLDIEASCFYKAAMCGMRYGIMNFVKKNLIRIKIESKFRKKVIEWEIAGLRKYMP